MSAPLQLQGNWLKEKRVINRLSDNGFTLLELMISVTIVAVMVLLVFSGLRIGIRAQEKGEENVESWQLYRTVFDLMHRQISSIRLNKIQTEDGKICYLYGTANQIFFSSYISLNPINRTEFVHARYIVKKTDTGLDQLLFSEYEPSMLNRDSALEASVESQIELIPETFSIAFRFLKAIDEAGNFLWQESWEPDFEKGLPLAVQLMVQETEDQQPLRMIARIIPKIRK
ncbi:MAG: type II secretion system protein [Deltaproteobacteria bacterium]|nr:type II secretion system protein [Deltaproteobacteria bacterium]